MKKRMILLLVLFLMPIAFGYTQEDEILETEVDIIFERGDCYWVNETCSWINLTIETEDDNYYFWNISNSTSLIKTIDIDFLRDIECDEECIEADIANLTTQLLEICAETTSQCDNVYTANTQCSIDLLGCRNANNETTDYRTQYNTCNTALATCNAKTCDTDWGAVLIAGVIGIFIGVMVQKSKGIAKGDIDKTQTPLKETEDLGKKGLDWKKLKEKGKELKDRIKEDGKNIKDKVSEGFG